MPSCSIKWCGKCSATSSYTKDGITFHRFPNDDSEKKKIWINATHRDNFFPTKHSVVCSRHFTPDCFETLKNNRRRLYSSSVPTLYLPSLTLPDDSENTQDQEPPLKDIKKESSTIIHEVRIKPDPDAMEHPDAMEQEEETNFGSEDTDKNSSSMFEGKQDFNDIAPILRDMSSSLQMMAKKNDDSFESFGNYVASMLRNMPEQNSREMQLQIVNLLTAGPSKNIPPTNAGEKS